MEKSIHMNFERGNRPKEAMGIGIGKRWTEAVKLVHSLYQFEPHSEELFEEMRARLEHIMELPVEGRFYYEGDEEEGEWKMEFKLIKDEVRKGK